MTRHRSVLQAVLGLLCAGVLAAAPGCAADDASVTGAEDEVVARNGNVDKALAYGRSLIGTPYGWWYTGPLPAAEPMWTAAGDAPSAAHVKARSTNCAGLTNLMLRSVGKPIPSDPVGGRGGTMAYEKYFAKVAKPFNVNTKYPAGTLVGRRFRDTFDQGHVGVVLENGHLLHSYATERGGALPGVNARDTVATSHAWKAGGFYEYVVLPEDWLGGGGASGGGAASGGSGGEGDADVGCKSGDGLYCGKNGVPGKTTNLYRCRGGKATLERECVSGCVHEEPGVDDRCAERVSSCRHGDGFYCGTNGVAGAADVLYSCTAGRVEPEKVCPGGCVQEAPGVDDHCR